MIGLICSTVGMFIGYSLGKKRSAEELKNKVTEIVANHELRDVSVGTIAAIKTSVDYHAEQAHQQYNDANYYMIKSLIFISCMPIIMNLIGDLIHVPND